MAVISGTCLPALDSLRALMAANLDAGAEAGLSVCVIHEGNVLADLWGGTADVASGTPWHRDTVVETFSATKTMTNLVALLLVDSGELDLDAPVARYWPEFAAAGKGDVLVRHVLGHTSGLAGWNDDMALADVYDTPAAAERLAAQEPWWTPGDGSGYHTVTQGVLIGELVRRVTGQSLGTVFRRELAEPLGADFWIGTPAAIDPRIATLIKPSASGSDYSALDPRSMPVRSLLNPRLDVGEVSSRAWRAAELGSVGGHGNARSVATVQAVVSHRTRLSDATTKRIFEVQSDGVDRVLGQPVTFGVGYGLPDARSIRDIPAGNVCWWTGWGGSLVVNDLDRALTFAYVMNKMTAPLIGLDRGGAYLRAVYEGLDRG